MWTINHKFLSKINAKGTKTIENNQIEINSVVDPDPGPYPMPIRILPEVLNMLENKNLLLSTAMPVYFVFSFSQRRTGKCHNFQYFRQ